MARKYKNPPVIMEILNRLYTITCYPAIQRFLEERGFLVPLLEEAYGQLQTYFPETPLFLNVFSDPEAGRDAPGGDTEQLALSIVTKLDVDEAMARLELFDRNWWLDALPRSHGEMVITLEFQ